MTSVCYISLFFLLFFFFKQKTAYEMRISDWSSDVCSSDLRCERSALLRGGLPVPPLGHVAADGIGQRLHHLPGLAGDALRRGIDLLQIGRASCRERVCQYV